MRNYLYKLSISNKFVLILLSIGVLTGCKEIIERDLSGEKPTLIQPFDGAKSKELGIEFRWEQIEQSLKYQLQVVSSSFDSILTTPIDSLVDIEKLSYTFNPGRYEWKIRAINGSSESDWSDIFSFQVDSSASVSNVLIELNTPSLVYLNIVDPLFTWKEISSAESYTLKITKGVTLDGELIQLSSNIDKGEFELTDDLVEGVYTWGVQAVNNSSSTFSQFTTRSFQVDLTAPSVSELNKPDNSVVRGDSINTFSWNRPADQGTVMSPLKDSIYLYKDSDQNSPFLVEGTFNQSLKIDFTNQSGKFVWKIKTFDEAGNESNFSPIRELEIQ